MLSDTLALHGRRAAFRTEFWFVWALALVHLCNACVRALLSTMLAAIVSLATIILEMFVKIHPHKVPLASIAFWTGK